MKVLVLLEILQTSLTGVLKTHKNRLRNEYRHEEDKNNQNLINICVWELCTHERVRDPTCVRESRQIGEADIYDILN